MRKRLVAAVAALTLAGGGVALYAATAGASVQVGNYIEVGCSTVQDVLVYTVIDRDGNPTGEMSAIGWACAHGPSDSLDLQNYVRVSTDPFGNVLVREYATRRAAGPPIAIVVVPDWERGHEH